MNRRIFMKRSGGGTLGVLLGMGVIPSVTKRLYAQDVSGEPGISGHLVGVTPTDIDTRLITMTDSRQISGGTLTTDLSIQFPDTAHDRCVREICVEIVSNMRWEKTVNGKLYHITFHTYQRRYHRCIDGVIMARQGRGRIWVTNGSGTTPDGQNQSSGIPTANDGSQLTYPGTTTPVVANGGIHETGQSNGGPHPLGRPKSYVFVPDKIVGVPVGQTGIVGGVISYTVHCCWGASPGSTLYDPQWDLDAVPDTVPPLLPPPRSLYGPKEFPVQQGESGQEDLEPIPPPEEDFVGPMWDWDE